MAWIIEATLVFVTIASTASISTPFVVIIVVLVVFILTVFSHSGVAKLQCGCLTSLIRLNIG